MGDWWLTHLDGTGLMGDPFSPRRVPWIIGTLALLLVISVPANQVRLDPHPAQEKISTWCKKTGSKRDILVEWLRCGRNVVRARARRRHAGKDHSAWGSLITPESRK